LFNLAIILFCFILTFYLTKMVGTFINVGANKMGY